MVLYAAERRSKKLFSMCTIQLALVKHRFVLLHVSDFILLITIARFTLEKVEGKQRESAS